MKILAFSDVHCDLEACERLVYAAEDADLVIGAGDFAQRREGLAPTMQALESIAHKAIYVPGNNESDQELRAATSAKVLHGNVCDIAGLRIGGIGCAIPELNIPTWRSFNLSEDAADHTLSEFKDINILISHSPPKGVADEISGLGSIGSMAVLNAVERLQPSYVLCGHIHDCWGSVGKIGNSVVMNLGPTINWIEV